MDRKAKITIITAIIIAGIISLSVITEPQIRTAAYWKRVSGSLRPTLSTDDIGASSSRVSKIWLDDLDSTSGTIGTLTISASSAGDITIQKADPSIVLDVTTAGDTDFWLGVQDDAGGDDDDTFQIGDSATPGTNPFLTIDTNGNVGIGTTSTAVKFEVSQSSGIPEVRVAQTTRGVVTKLTAGEWPTGEGDGASLGVVSNHPLGIMTNNTVRLAITTTGKVGIGTTGPTQKLQVAGDVVIDEQLALGGASIDNNRAINISTTGSTPGDIYYDVSSTMTISGDETSGYSLGSEVMVSGIDAYGGGVYGKLQTANDANAQQVYGKYSYLVSHASDTAYGDYVIDYIGDSTGGTQYGLYVDLDDPDVTNYSIYVNAGSGISYFGSNVGIGTTGPDRLLHAEASTALTNTVQQVMRLSHITSGTPANNIGVGIEFEQETSAGNNEVIATITAVATDVTGGSEDAKLTFNTMASGTTAAERMTIGTGVVIGSPTGGDKGAGTLNATAVYDDNVLLTDYVFDKFFDGKVRAEDTDKHGDYTMLTIDEMSKFIETKRHLPTMVSREEWEKEGKLSTGQLINQLWETVETQALYISILNKRISALEKSISALEKSSGE